MATCLGQQSWPQVLATTSPGGIIRHAGLGSRIGHAPGQKNLPQVLATELATCLDSKMVTGRSSRINHKPNHQTWARKPGQQNWPQAWAAEFATCLGNNNCHRSGQQNWPQGRGSSRIDRKPKQHNLPPRPGQQSGPHAWAAELATGLGNRISHRPGQQKWPQAAAAELATSRGSRTDRKPKQQNRPCRLVQQNLPHAWAAEFATGLGNRVAYAGLDSRIGHGPGAAELATGIATELATGLGSRIDNKLWQQR